MSLKDDILQCVDRETITVHVPEWQRDVYLTTMSAGAFMDWASFSIDEKGNPHRNEHRQATVLVACCLADEEGNRLFDPITKDDLAALLKKNYRVITRLAEQCMRLNFMDVPALEAAEKTF